jgi:hypothetical protein
MPGPDLNRRNFCVVRSLLWMIRIRKDSLAWMQKRVYSSACPECIHRPRYDHFCLAPITLAGHLGWIIRTILLFFLIPHIQYILITFDLLIFWSFDLLIFWSFDLLIFCISVTREQDICATIRCEKFEICATLCTPVVNMICALDINMKCIT